MVSPRRLFNRHPPQTLGAPQRPPGPEDYPRVGLKYACLDFARPYLTPYVLEMIAKVPLSRDYRYTLIDVKVHDLVTGVYPCLPGWHCDGFIDPRQGSRGETHYLFVTGQGARTEFLKAPIELEFPPRKRGKALLHSFQTQLRELEPKAEAVPSCQWVRFGRWDFHRGPRARLNEKRLFLRITESDVLRPNKKVERYPPGQGALVHHP